MASAFRRTFCTLRPGTPVIEIRDERPADVAAIRELTTRAFGQEEEARIIDRLRSNGAAMLSLVAAREDRVLGHIMYSPVLVGGVSGAGLGPMAVVPEHQRQGIGTRLVEQGNRRLQETGCPFIVVVGHPRFYPRFGFVPASTHGISCEWNVPDDVFMVLMLDRMRMRSVSGLARYRPEFKELS